MRISPEALCGYLLEEVLAFLVKNAGYRLLVDESQDPRELTNRHNGLAVIGRGGFHQVDVLGQLEWIPAFTFPIRLFVEAKFRRQKAGIAETRKAIGVVNDLRENISPLRDKVAYPQKYHYCFALFSTSGFTKNASTLALAHEISLIDLAIPHFGNLLLSIQATSRAILHRYGTRAEHVSPAEDEDVDLAELPSPQTEPSAPISRDELIRDIRNALRIELGTMPEGIISNFNRHQDLYPYLIPLVQTAQHYQEVFIGMVNGPFMLFSHADNPGKFIEFCRAHPRHSIEIKWSRELDEGRTWWIQPVDYDEQDRPYRLQFRLPQMLLDWMLGQEQSPRESALSVKQRFLSQILIYRVSEKDELFRLQFNTEQVAQERRLAHLRPPQSTNPSQANN